MKSEFNILLKLIQNKFDHGELTPRQMSLMYQFLILVLNDNATNSGTLIDCLLKGYCLQTVYNLQTQSEQVDES